MTEDETVRWHRRLSGPQETVKDREAWRAVVHGVTELDMTEQLNNSEADLSKPLTQFSSVTQSCPTLCDPVD